MNPFDRYNPAHPHVVVFSSGDKPTVERVGEFLLSAGYHPSFNYSPTHEREFEPEYTYQVFVPANEVLAAREVLAKYERDEFII